MVDDLTIPLVDAKPPAKPAHSKAALLGTLLAALAVVVGSLGPFHILNYRFLHWHIPIYGTSYTTPHDLMHILSFGLLGVLAWLISDRWPPRAATAAGALLLGLAIEWLQTKVYRGVAFETRDLLADALGICLGILLAYLR